jgi:hypothetical protein
LVVVGLVVVGLVVVGVVGVIGGDEVAFAVAVDEGPAVVGLQPVVMPAQAVQVLEHGVVGVGPRDAMVDFSVASATPSGASCNSTGYPASIRTSRGHAGCHVAAASRPIDRPTPPRRNGKPMTPRPARV